jgi:hypothetical protein
VPRRLTGAVSESVPLAIVWLALVELVKVAKVPRPAIEAAEPSTAIESRSFRAGKRFRRMVVFSAPEARETSPGGGITKVN